MDFSLDLESHLFNFMKTTNYLLSDLISKINFGAIRRLRFIQVNLNDTTLDILKILYKQGVIRSFIIKNNKILIYYKYYISRMVIKLSIVSKPGNRIY
jgi:ribosomal protein S8